MEPENVNSSSPTQEPIATSSSETPPRKSRLLYILAGIILVFLLGGAYVLGGRNSSQPLKNTAENTNTSVQVSPTKPQAVIKDAGIPIKENTVSFTRLNGKIYIRYEDKIYDEDAAHKNDLTNINLPDLSNQTWIGLVDAPEIPKDLNGFDEVFDLATLPKDDFIFIMRWPTLASDDFVVYRYNSTSIPHLATLVTYKPDSNGKAYNVPRIQKLDSSKRYIAFSMYGCWNCGGHQPETMLYDLNTNKTKKIGKTSLFNWKGNGSYEYKEYKVIPCPTPFEGPGECAQDNATLSLLTGSMQ